MKYILLAIVTILVIFIVKRNYEEDYLPDTHYTKMAQKGKLILPPPEDYQNLFGGALDYLNKGYNMKDAITLSFVTNPDAVYRKIQRMNTAVLIYLRNNRLESEKDPDLNTEILSALSVIPVEDRLRLLDMCTFPQKYITIEDKQEEIRQFINFYATIADTRNNIIDRFRIYATRNTWLNAVPETRAYKNNNVSRYLWGTFQTIIMTPVIFCKNVPVYQPEVNELAELIKKSFITDKSRLIQIDFTNEYLDSSNH